MRNISILPPFHRLEMSPMRVCSQDKSRFDTLHWDLRTTAEETSSRQETPLSCFNTLPTVDSAFAMFEVPFPSKFDVKKRRFTQKPTKCQIRAAGKRNKDRFVQVSQFFHRNASRIRFKTSRKAAAALILGCKHLMRSETFPIHCLTQSGSITGAVCMSNVSRLSTAPRALWEPSGRSSGERVRVPVVCDYVTRVLIGGKVSPLPHTWREGW